MKKHFTLIFLLFALNTLNAQDTILVHPTLPVSSDFTGTGLVWDCSTASLEQEQPIFFRPKLNNPSRLSVYDGYTHYHLILHEDTTLLIGYENRSFQISLIQPTLRFCSVALGDTIRDSFFGQGEYCHSTSYTIDGSSYLTTDASGLMKLPLGSFQVTRSRFHRDITMYGLDTVNVIEDTYQWFSPAIAFPLFEQHEVREFVGGEDTLVVCQAIIYDLSEEELTQITQVDSLQAGANMVISSLMHYPNPVVSQVTAQYTLGIDADIHAVLTTSSGLPMWSQHLGMQEAGEHSITIDMSAYPRGSYELHVTTGGLTVSETIIKI